jgi:amidase
MDAVGLAALVRAGEVSPLELVDAAIAQIELRNPQINAVVSNVFDRALDVARAGNVPDGPFCGVPFLFKDLLCPVAGLALSDGSRALRELGWVEPADGHLAARLRSAGFIFLGRTCTSELGLLPTAEPFAYRPVRNPWAPEHSTGGSSGGSAAAVASGMVPVAHANDGAGSIRIPAAACGVVGLKPSRGRTPPAPDLGEVLGGIVVDHVVTRTVRDTAALLDVLSNREAGPPSGAATEPRRLRVGLLTAAPGGYVETERECADAVSETAHALDELGHDVEDRFPDALLEREALQARGALWMVGAAAAVDRWGLRTGVEVDVELLEPATRLAVERGRRHSTADRANLLESLELWSRRVLAWWEQFDLLVTPVTARPVPELGILASSDDDPGCALRRGAELAPFTSAYNATGQPAISLPIGSTAAGLPVGVQLVANVGRDDVLLAVAAQLERARPWTYPRAERDAT